MNKLINNHKKSKLKVFLVSTGFTITMWVLWISFGTVMSSCSNNPDMTLASNYVQQQLALDMLPYNLSCNQPPYLGSYYDGATHLTVKNGNTIRFSMWKTSDPGNLYYVHDWINIGGSIQQSQNGYNPALTPTFTTTISGIPVLNYWVPKPGLVASYTFAFQVKDMCQCTSGSSTAKNANYHYLKVSATPNNPPQTLQYWTDYDLLYYCNSPLPATI